jgi:hypothetical protein
MSKSEDKRHEAANKLLDELLGPVEGWEDTELDQFLADAGVDIDAASRAIFERVSDIAATYRKKNQDIPVPVAEFLKQMRPPDLPTADPEVAKRSARKWIASLRRPRPAPGTMQVAYAFRNKKEKLGPKDRAILDGLEAKLRDRKREGDV